MSPPRERGRGEGAGGLARTHARGDGGERMSGWWRDDGATSRSTAHRIASQCASMFGWEWEDRAVGCGLRASDDDERERHGHAGIFFNFVNLDNPTSSSVKPTTTNGTRNTMRGERGHDDVTRNFATQRRQRLAFGQVSSSSSSSRFLLKTQGERRHGVGSRCRYGEDVARRGKQLRVGSQALRTVTLRRALPLDGVQHADALLEEPHELRRRQGHIGLLHAQKGLGDRVGSGHVGGQGGSWEFPREHTKQTCSAVPCRAGGLVGDQAHGGGGASGG